MSALGRLHPFRTAQWDPFRDLGGVDKRWDELMGRLFPPKNGGQTETLTVAEWSPLVDIAEDEKEYLIKAELPGLKKEEVKVVVEKGQLTLSGERRFEKEEKNKKYHRVERSYGSFVRTFTLPEGVNAAKVSAEFADGVLKVHLPKDETPPKEAMQVNVT